jgi:hypothetical protein
MLSKEEWNALLLEEELQNIIGEITEKQAVVKAYKEFDKNCK